MRTAARRAAPGPVGRQILRQVFDRAVSARRIDAPVASVSAATAMACHLRPTTAAHGTPTGDANREPTLGISA
jgi:hypothetical protein